MNAPLLLLCSAVLMICGLTLMIQGFRQEQTARRKPHHHSSPH